MENLSLEELRAQFQQLQSKPVKNRLSERNCVDIILKLIKSNQITLYFTLDGKEYVTPERLEKEILEEVSKRKGRLTVAELQPIFNIDSHHIETCVESLVGKQKGLKYVDGEIITNYYLDRIAIEIEEALQASGEIGLGELASRFLLSGELIENLISKKLGKIIHGKLIAGILFTEAALSRIRAQIRGTFSAITKPTSVYAIYSRLNIPDEIFWSILDKLIQEGRINGSIQGRREKSTYIPTIFSEARTKWVISFFKSNKYVEYHALEKFLIPNPRNFLESLFKDGISLQSCYLSKEIVNQVDGLCAEAISSNSWIDISPYVPSHLTNSDFNFILEQCSSIQKQGKNIKAIILKDCFVVSKGLLDKLIALYEQTTKENAEKGILPKSEILSKSTENIEEEETKKGSKKSRRTTQKKGNKEESETPKTPPKGKSQSAKDSNSFVTENLSDFRKWVEDAPDDMLEALISYLTPTLNEIKERIARSIFVTTTDTKKKNNSFIDNANTLYQNILLFQAGVKQFQDEEVLLEKHLLKTHCKDLVNMILENQAMFHFLNIPKVETPADRAKVLSQLPSNEVKSFQKLIDTLTGKSVEDFLGELDNVSDLCQIRFKKIEKKKEKQLLTLHKQAFMDQLITETDPGTCFHLVLVLLYLNHFSVVLHTPPRCLSLMLNKLKQSIAPEIHSFLQEYQTLVTIFLTNKYDLATKKKLTEKLPNLKEIILGKEQEKKEE